VLSVEDFALALTNIARANCRGALLSHARARDRDVIAQDFGDHRSNSRISWCGVGGSSKRVIERRQSGLFSRAGDCGGDQRQHGEARVGIRAEQPIGIAHDGDE
jgi:hypothetical protein